MNESASDKSIIKVKSYAFALSIIELFKYLSDQKKEYILSKQLLRSGTSIGANINEALAGQSKRDFVHKLNISLKEARESLYWINLLKDSGYIDNIKWEELSMKCNELIKILSSIILTTKEKYFTNNKS